MKDSKFIIAVCNDDYSMNIDCVDEADLLKKVDILKSRLSVDTGIAAYEYREIVKCYGEG